jgi:hypothetical protein
LDLPGRTVYFDPSYGVTYSGANIGAALTDFQKKAVSGFYVMVPTANPNIRAMALRKPDNTKQEFVEG